MILSVCAVSLSIFGGAKVEEMGRTVDFVVKLLRVG